jgi:hypothetical protein
MNATLSFLGTVMLILVAVAVLLALVILVLFEARWIVHLGTRLRSARTDELRESDSEASSP